MPIQLDPRYTFENFVVGQANRLAAAAGRRVAESPGTTYNPLFIYSGSGLGKTHLLNAIGHHAARLHPQLEITYDTLIAFLERMLAGIRAGERDVLPKGLEAVNFLLLDDVQFLGGRRAEQEALLRAWDSIAAQGGQIVLASDRPPAEIAGLDQRLTSRFSGGLIADIGAPDYETRVAIVKRKALERRQQLGAGVAEALAKLSFDNVRELQGGLNRVLAVQDLDGRTVVAGEVAAILGYAGTADEFSGFLSEIAGTVTQVITETLVERKLGAAIKRWKANGYTTRRLEAALTRPPAEDELDAFIQQYEKDVQRLQEIEAELRRIEPNAPELARAEFFRSPDRLVDAEELLQTVRNRNRPLPAAPAGRSFRTLSLAADSFAVRAARAIAETPGEAYNPFFVYGPEGQGKTTLLAALVNEIQQRNPGRPVAFVHGKHFAHELIDAIERNAVDSWRDRYAEAAVFVIDDVDALAGTERAQDELFHLFETLKRNGAQLAFAGERHPREIDGLDERLRSRLESGLVAPMREAAGDAVATRAQPAPALTVAESVPVAESGVDEWFLSREKVLWSWPYLDDSLLEELE